MSDSVKRNGQKCLSPGSDIAPPIVGEMQDFVWHHRGVTHASALAPARSGLSDSCRAQALWIGPAGNERHVSGSSALPAGKWSFFAPGT